MSIPNYEAFMLPMLQVLATDAAPLDVVADRVAERLGLSADDRTSRPAWAHEPMLVSRTRVTAEWLAAAGLVNREDDRLSLEERGRELLDENPTQLGRDALRRFPEFEAYLQAYLARQGA